LAENIVVLNGVSKQEQYQALIPQIESLVGFEKDLTANLSNICAALKTVFNFFWVGFYLVKGDELVLGPFQGPVACTRIKKGKGVCGTAWENKQSILVPDVNLFPGHIACSSEAKSELVIPGITSKGTVFLVLDVDSQNLNDFDHVDKKYLTMIVNIIEHLHEQHWDE